MSRRSLLSGRSNLGNFVGGTVAGIIALAWVVLVIAVVAAAFDWRLLWALLGAPLLGLLVMVSGMTPEVKLMLDGYEQAEAIDEAGEARQRERLGHTLEGLDKKFTRSND